MEQQSIIKTIIDAQFDEAIRDLKEIKNIDTNAIDFFIYPNKEYSDVSAWINKYHVQRNTSPKTRKQAVNWLKNNSLSVPISENPIPEKIAEALNEVNQKILELQKSDNKKRKIKNHYSLASKLLWLKYPESVPIYDKFAKNALSLIINCNQPGTNNKDKRDTSYTKFFIEWCSAYVIAEPIIKQKLIDRKITISYSPVRIFDKILYWAGKPRY